MKRAYAICVAAGLALATALPAFAETKMDVAKMTCKEFAAMDGAGMMKATMAIKTAAMEDKMADPAKVKMADADMMAMIAKSCEGKPDMMTMDAMHPKM